jgi:HD-like signal output (HDOD) protein
LGKQETSELQHNQKLSPPGVFVSLPSSDDAVIARDELLQKISDDSNLPALGSSVSRVVQLASSDDEAVRNLAHFVLSDVALTQKVLRMANTVYYRASSGMPITTITKAIFLLGFESVKTSALAILLVDSMSGKRGQSVRAELSNALTASVIGREMAKRSHFKDAEEAAVAALFRNIGRVLIASYDHNLYRQITTLINNGTAPGIASMQVVGCSFDMLAEAVLQEWQIPDTIVKAATALLPSTIKPAKTRHEWMQQVAAFSSAAAPLIRQMNLPDQEQAQEQSYETLLKRFGAALELDRDKLAELLTVVARETTTLTANSDLMPSANAELMQHHESESHESHSELGLPSELLLLVPEAPSLQIEMRHPSGKPVNARELLFAGVQDVTEMMASGRCKTNDLIMLVLETLYRSLGFRFATICLKDARTNQFRARIALGEDNVARQAGFVFPATPTRDLFHLSMENEADLLISDASDPKIQNLIPAWHRKLLPDARSFMVLPIVVQKKPFGLFYADRALVASEGMPADETALIKTLKGQVLAALNTR